MASYPTFLPSSQESKFNAQRTPHRTTDRKKEDLIALPPVRALATTTSPENHSDRLLTPLSKWQLQRCTTPNTSYCQEEMVNEWLHRNHIRVVERLPKMDPIVLTSRGTDVSKYINFIHPPPFSLKILSSSTEEKKSRDRTQKRLPAHSPVSSSPCPRLLRSQRSERETFALNPVIRVGGGYRRLSWKVLDVLPSIGQFDPDLSPGYTCAVCNAILPVVEKVTNSRGQLRSILTTPKECHKCGAPTTEYHTHAEKDLHESVLDTLHRGDSRFIVDHRRFQNSHAARVSPTNNGGVWEPSSPVDWRDDMESFRIHMSRQSEREEDLDTRDQEYAHGRSESGSSSVFMTEPGTNIDKLNEPPDVRRAWDDGIARTEITRDDGNESGNWDKGKEDRSHSSDLDAYSDFEMIEDYDPKSGFTVRLRRRPFGGAEQTNYLIYGIQDEEAASTKSLSKGKRPRQRGKEKIRHSKQRTQTDAQEKKSSKNQGNKQTFAGRKASKHKISHDVNGNEEKLRENETLANQITKHSQKSLQRTESFFTVGLDRRDYVFTETPVIEEVVDDNDDDVDIVFSHTRFSEDSFSDFEFHGDSWSPGPLGPGQPRPSMPSPAEDQDDADYSSSLSISPTQHDGYLADSEENVDLSSLQAQIQQARNNTKKHQRRKEEGQEIKRRESRERKAKDQHSQAKDDSPSQNPMENDTLRATLNSAEWDSDWDSDFSLHVQPLSDLSESSSNEELWENGTKRRTTNPDTEERTRKWSDKTIVRRKESKPDRDKGPQNEGAVENGPRRSIAGEDQVRTRKTSRTVVKPIRRIGPESDNEDVPARPRLRAPRGSDELSESDMNFFTQQFQVPSPRKNQENGANKQSPDGCKGINCYRCSAFIPECGGVCSKCGTLCQRPGGPCKACRDICESCGKPRYKCTSADERLEASDDDKDGDEEHVDTDDDEARMASREETTSASKGDFNSHVPVSAVKTDREGSLLMIDGEPNNADQGSVRKNKERKIRAPPERKSKDVNSIKRVRAKRNTSRNINEQGESVEDKDDVIELDKHREPIEPAQVEEDIPVEPQSQLSSIPLKSTKKTKPSKKIISQIVVYKEKEKTPKSKRKSSKQQEETGGNLVATSPTRVIETVESGEEIIMTDGEGTGEEVPPTKQGEEGDKVAADVTKNDNDVKTKPEEREETKKEQEKTKEKEKVEQEQKEEELKKVVPKVRGVNRVNAAFKERAELGKRLQNVLKEAISDVMGQADIKTRKDSTIDYLAQYRLVDRSRLEMYGRAFTLEDENEDGIISYEQMLLALEGVPSIAGMSRKQLLFVLQVLELFPGSRITFKMFSVTTALCEKVTILDAFVKQLVEELDLFELECKLDMFRNMFFVTGDYSVTFITADQLRIELKAGGLNQQQEDHVIGHILQSTDTGEISFLDYMAYLPLFLSIHQNICDNALDMSRNKYQRKGAT
ncbi:uncharacterized protein LOC144628969 isoform X2 [Oculina patagonica]